MLVLFGLMIRQIDRYFKSWKGS